MLVKSRIFFFRLSKMALRVTRVRSSPRRKGRRDIYKSKGDVDFISSPRKMRINRAKIPSTTLEILLEK